MRRLSVIFFLLLTAAAARAQNLTLCPEWRISEVNQLHLPYFADNQSVDGKPFDNATLLESVRADAAGIEQWQVLSPGTDSLISLVSGKDQLLQLAGFVKSDRWTKASVKISTNAIFEVYLDGNKIKTQDKPAEKPVKVELTLGTGVHSLLLKMISTEKSLRFAAGFTTDNDAAKLTWTTNPKRTVTIHDILEGENVSNARLSPSGKYLLIQSNEILPGSGKSQPSFSVFDMELNRNLFSVRNNAFRANWLPETDKLYYQVEKEGHTDVLLWDMKTGEESLAASGLKSPGNITWSPKEDYFLFLHNQEAEKTGDLKRIFDNDDRIPGTRNRSYLYLFDLKAKIARPLTAGSESAELHDIRPDGSRILFSTSLTDYSVATFSRQTLYELDPFSMVTDTIWKNNPHGGYCQYSPDGTQLLVSGGPETFGELGIKVSKGRIPNSYDTQLFLYNIKTKKVEALTRVFDPAVASAYWSKDGKIYLTADRNDYVNLYRLDVKKNNFTKIDIPVEVITSVDYAANQSRAVYKGSSISTPEKLFALDLTSGKSTLLLDPKAEQIKEVEFGRTEEWNFINSGEKQFMDGCIIRLVMILHLSIRLL